MGGPAGWASETNSDASEGELEVDLDCEEENFTLEDGEIVAEGHPRTPMVSKC
jgi:hypothetical protein